jgi:putative sterol carrier protein
MLLGARLAVDGDTDLALRLGGVFQVPGQPGVAVDPAAVDPAAAARLLGGVDDGHLREVMSGGFRPVVLEQVFARFPEFLDTSKADGQAVTVGFKITRDGGDADRYVVRVADGACLVDDAPDPAGPRDVTLTLSGADFLKLVTGHLSPVAGVMRGAIKIRGDVAAALTLHRIMQIPG